MSARRIVLVLLLMLLTCQQALAQMLILTDSPETALDKRNAYPEKLLRQVMDRTIPAYGEYQIRFMHIAMDRKRLLHELERGEIVNLSAKASQSEWEKKLLPIRIPIDKGIGGYRLFHIRAVDQSMFDRISGVDELKQLNVGVQQGWSSLPLYQAYDFKIVTGNNYDGLFGMLDAGRFDYLPRGLEEVFIEHDLRHARYPDLAVEEHLLLYYPFPKYFFVSPKTPKLAERIKVGLQAMLADGSFDRLFYEHHAELLQRAKLCQRRVFRLGNPELPPDTPRSIKKYWYDPQQLPAKYGGCKK